MRRPESVVSQFANFQVLWIGRLRAVPLRRFVTIELKYDEKQHATRLPVLRFAPVPCHFSLLSDVPDIRRLIARR